jgi:CRP-like cAMP-binding protein
MNLLHRHESDQKIAWLAARPWWRDLPAADLEALAATGDRVTVPAGRRLMTEGTRGYESAVVISGELAVIRDGEPVARLSAGDVVGELSLLDHTPRTADVETVTEVELLVFSSRSLQRVLAASATVREQVTAAADEHRG